MAVLLSSGCAASNTATPAVTTGEDINRVRVIVQGGGATINTDIQRTGAVFTRRIEADPARVWSALPSAYQLLGLEMNLGNAASRMLGFENVRVQRIEGKRLSTAFDCGQGAAGPNADSHEVTMSMMTQVVPSGSATDVRVQVEASARNRAHGGSNVPCLTSGAVEARMFELLRELAG